ncbi:MAG: hypothetical protein PVH41_09195, partial [Anaerolineae bacterium]
MLENIFSNETDHGIGTGVLVDIDEFQRAASFSFGDVLIESNEFYISDDGVYLDLQLDFHAGVEGLSATIGDVDILDNLFDMEDTDGVDIVLTVDDVSTGTVSIGDIVISSTNVFSGGDRGVHFDGNLEDFIDTTVTVGDFKVNDNTFEGQAGDAVRIDDYYHSGDWQGTTTATFGKLELNRNHISSTQANCHGIYVGRYARWEHVYDDVVVTV